MLLLSFEFMCQCLNGAILSSQCPINEPAKYRNTANKEVNESGPYSSSSYHTIVIPLYLVFATPGGF